MTQKQLLKLAREWVQVLRLQDWRIDVRFVRGEEINGCFGETSINFPLKTAYVKICRPEDMKYKGYLGSDIEETLVHELIHLHIEVLCRNAGQDSELRFLAEQAIEAMSLALVGLKRRAS